MKITRKEGKFPTVTEKIETKMVSLTTDIKIEHAINLEQKNEETHEPEPKQKVMLGSWILPEDDL